MLFVFKLSNYLDKYRFFWNALTTLPFAYCKNTWDVLFNVFTVDCLHSCKALADFFQGTLKTNDQMESVPSKCASKTILRIFLKRKRKSASLFICFP
jgi:hypothetical protein